MSIAVTEPSDDKGGFIEVRDGHFSWKRKSKPAAEPNERDRETTEDQKHAEEKGKTLNLRGINITIAKVRMLNSMAILACLQRMNY